MAWEENSHICINMQLIAILSRTGVIQSDSVVTDSAKQGAVEVAVPVDTTASSENASTKNAATENASSENAATENAATEVPAKSESNATAENAEATVDSAVAQ